MAGYSQWFEAAKEGVSLASTYMNAAYNQAVDTATFLANKAQKGKQKAEKATAENNNPIESQEGELAQGNTPDPTGKWSMNHVNRCASLVDEYDLDEWDDAYLPPGTVNQDKAKVEIGILVENGEWVYLLGRDRQ